MERTLPDVDAQGRDWARRHWNFAMDGGMEGLPLAGEARYNRRSDALLKVRITRHPTSRWRRVRSDYPIRPGIFVSDYLNSWISGVGNGPSKALSGDVRSTCWPLD